MAEGSAPAKTRLNSLTIVLMIFVLIFVVLGGVFSPWSNSFLPGIEGIVDTVLNVGTYIIYLIGGGILIFGAVLVTIRFVQSKLKDPDKFSNVSRYLSGYLTLGLEFFIGAEIIRTVAFTSLGSIQSSLENLLVLFLIILSRVLFSLIIYLDRRWHGTAETE